MVIANHVGLLIDFLHKLIFFLIESDQHGSVL